MLRQMLYYVGQAAMQAYIYTLLDMDVRFSAPLPAGPKILAANHPTTLDPFLLLTITREEVSILVTEFCFNLPVFGRYLRAAGHIPVVRSQGRTAFDEAARSLQQGRTIGVFPEGALSPIAGGVCRAHTGAARLAMTAHIPLIPIGIAVQRERIRFRQTQAGDMTETARWYFSGKYVMTIGEPLFLEGEVNDRVRVRSTTDHILQRIVELTAQSAARLPSAPTTTVLALGR